MPNNGHKRYTMNSHVTSGDAKGIVVQIVELTGPSITITATQEFLGVAAVLPPPAPPLALQPTHEYQNTLIAYVGPFVGPTTVNIPGNDWSQVYVVYLPLGLATPNLLSSISDAINATSSPNPGDGTSI